MGIIHFIQSQSILFIVTFCALFAVSCANHRATAKLNQVAGEQRSELETLFENIESSPVKQISWDQAHRKMVQDNLSLRQSRQQLEQESRATRNQWISLVPRLGAFINLGENLTELSSLSNDDINAQLIANLNIPNPFDFYAGLYGAALQQQNAEWSHQLDRRRAYVQLYTLFNEAQLIQESEKSLNKRLERIGFAALPDLQNQLESLHSEADVIRRRKAYHRTQINSILNTPGANWKIEGLPPKIPSLNENQRIRIGKDFGKLALNLQAIQIEGAQLRIQQTKFRQWPTLSFGLGTPALYSSTSDNQSFSADNMLFFTGANKSFDPVDPINIEQIRDARLRLQYTKEQLRLRAESEVLQIAQARELYDKLTKEEQRIARRSQEWYGTASAEPELLFRELDSLSQEERKRLEILRQLKQMDLQFLIWYDKFWESY